MSALPPKTDIGTGAVIRFDAPIRQLGDIRRHRRCGRWSLPSYVDAQLDAQDAKDRAELIERDAKMKAMQQMAERGK